MSQQKRSNPPSQGGRRATRSRVPLGDTGGARHHSGGRMARLSRRRAVACASGVPGPAGGRDVAQDVNTLVGQGAPSFTLSTAEGQVSDVTKPLRY